MSLEKTLQEATEAIKALTLALTRANVKADAAAAATPKADAPKADAPKADAPKADAPKALTYDDVKKPFLALVTSHGRDHALKVLADAEPASVVDEKASLKNIEKKPESFAKVLEAIKAAAAKPVPKKEEPKSDDLA